MFLPMPNQYNDVQDYYPPLSSQSRSSSPSLHSPPRSPSSSIPSASLSSLGAGRRSSHAYPYRARNAPPAPPTSIPLDDNFDAPTTEVPTEWALRSQPEGHPEYDESVTGYQNYVVEMERMLAGQMESSARSQERVREAYKERDSGRQHQQQGRERRTSTSPSALRRIDTSLADSVRSSSRAGAGRRSLGSHGYANAPMSPPPPPPENARQVSGKKGRLELVEQRVLEDSATRTISLWRERVAASSVGSNAGDNRDKDERSEAGSHVHRRVPSGSVNGDSRLRRVVSDHARYASLSSTQGGRSRSGSVRGDEKGKTSKASYERSEYLVSYHSTKAGLPKELFAPRSEASAAPARELRTPSSPTTNRTYFEKPPASPTLHRHAARKSLERNEYMMSYPQTPPLTGSQASSGSPSGRQGLASPPPVRSPLQGSFRDMREALSPVAGSERSLAKVTTTSSVEAILASCDPSLLHIAPVLEELGIKRVDHLRAVARLSEETRDREVKEQALKRGVTVVEWAIFLDKLQAL